MKSFLSLFVAALVLGAGLLLPSAAGSAAAGGPPLVSAAVSPAFSEATPTGTTTPPGPVDPGTGETPAAKDTRVDYAPYVIAAALVLAIAAAALVWRRGRGGPSSKSLRRADHPTDNQGNTDDRRTGH